MNCPRFNELRENVVELFAKQSCNSMVGRRWRFTAKASIQMMSLAKFMYCMFGLLVRPASLSIPIPFIVCCFLIHSNVSKSRGVYRRNSRKIVVDELQLRVSTWLANSSIVTEEERSRKKKPTATANYLAVFELKMSDVCVYGAWPWIGLVLVKHYHSILYIRIEVDGPTPAPRLVLPVQLELIE